MALLQAATCGSVIKHQVNLGVSPEGVDKKHKYTKTHDVRDAWARRYRKVNGYADEDPKASAIDDQKML